VYGVEIGPSLRPPSSMHLLFVCDDCDDDDDDGSGMDDIIGKGGEDSNAMSDGLALY